jgi:secreted trypsin-like serine protease
MNSNSGDSGGPLFVNEKLLEPNGTSVRAFLIGAVSRGHGCARMNYPGIYSRIKALLPWIKLHTMTPQVFTKIGLGVTSLPQVRVSFSPTSLLHLYSTVHYMAVALPIPWIKLHTMIPFTKIGLWDILTRQR